MHIDDVRKMQAQKDHAMRHEGKHPANNTEAHQHKHDLKESYWDMPGYNENDERAKIDAKWKAGHDQRMADNEKYGTNYKD